MINSIVKKLLILSTFFIVLACGGEGGNTDNSISEGDSNSTDSKSDPVKKCDIYNSLSDTRSCDFSGIFFYRHGFTDMDFTGSNFSGAIFESEVRPGIGSVKFSDSDFTSTYFDQTTSVDRLFIENSTIHNTVFDNLIFKDMAFFRTVITESSLKNLTQEIRFDSATTFDRVDFTGSFLPYRLAEKMNLNGSVCPNGIVEENGHCEHNLIPDIPDIPEIPEPECGEVISLLLDGSTGLSLSISEYLFDNEQYSLSYSIVPDSSGSRTVQRTPNNGDIHLSEACEKRTRMLLGESVFDNEEAWSIEFVVKRKDVKGFIDANTPVIDLFQTTRKVTPDTFTVIYRQGAGKGTSTTLDCDQDWEMSVWDRQQELEDEFGDLNNVSVRDILSCSGYTCLSLGLRPVKDKVSCSFSFPAVTLPRLLADGKAPFFSVALKGKLESTNYSTVSGHDVWLLHIY
ncbi:MAG: hypothetical protein HRU20_19215 [Pseudomonadales bacterium]|nr:hypothetical protein [Pseudomonadales bacterium]